MIRRNPTLELLSSFVNGVLALDAEVFEQLSEFEHELLEVQVEGVDDSPAMRLWIRFGERGINIEPAGSASDEEPLAPSVVISGPPLALLGIVTSPDADRPIPPGVSITGEVMVAQRLQVVMRRLRIDWEELLSRYVGDVGAHEMARHARSGWQWGTRAVESLMRDCAEYLVEEVRRLAEPHEVRAFADAVDDLRDDVERLQLRVQRLLSWATENRP